MEENQIIVDVGLDAFIASLRHLQKQYELNTAALKAMKDAGEEQSDAYITLTQEQKVLRQQMASTEKAMQNEIKMQQAQEGSLVQLRAQLANLNKQYDSMSGMERMGKSGEELQGRIKALHDQILGLEGDTGRMQRNVGNYPEAMKPVTAQLREMTQQLVQLRMEGKANTAEYNDLLKKTGEMKDAMEDAQREVKQMASDTSALNSVLAGAQAAAGAFSVALGVMNLVGDKDSETAKELAEAQRKLQSAIAITTGLQGLQNALQKESALMMGINKIQVWAAAKAQDAYTAATGRATVAQRLFNTVAKANPYVLLAAAILSVVGALAAFSAGTKEAKEHTAELNDKLKEQYGMLGKLASYYDTVTDKMIRYYQENIEKMKLEGKSIEKIREAEDKMLDYEDERLKRLESGFASEILNIENMAKRIDQKTVELHDIQIQYDYELRRGNIDFAESLKSKYDNLKAELERERDLYTQTADIINRRAELDNRRRETVQRRQEEDTKKITRNVKELKRETQELVEILTSEDIYNRIEQRNAHLAESFQKVADRVGLLKEGFEQLDPNKFGSSFVSDEGLQDNTTKMELWAEAWKNNASEIQETTTALESSFGSLSAMYQSMANDESKTEEEREKAAKKAKALAGIQIGANAGAAIAKGVASAVDVGFPAAIPAMATMMAAILAAIAQAKALVAEAHEHGGVIGGKFTGATRGSDNVLMTGRRGELVLNAEQQRRLYNIANGGASTNLTAELAEALRSMPAPVLVYSEFQRFTDRVVTLDNASKLN